MTTLMMRRLGGVLAALALLGLTAAPAAAQTYEFLFEFGSEGSEPGQFRSPFGVAVDPDSGAIVVADTGNNRIQVFDSACVHQLTFGVQGSGDGQFRGPIDVAVDPTSGDIVVADSNNQARPVRAGC